MKMQMSAFLRFKHFVFSASLFVLCAVLPSLRATDTSEIAGLESTLAKRLSPGGPGVAVLVARNGKVLFSHAYGLADREKQIPVTPETHFLIGSVTKQFTASAILRLAEEGKLSIDDSLSKYFPSYPGGDKITLRLLLTHTSGLHNLTDHPDFFDRCVRYIAPADLLAWFEHDPPDFPPGEQFKYCNTGYVLLGQIVEKVSGQALGDYWQNQFFGPLGMHDTGIWVNAAPPPHSAKGYSSLNQKLQPAIAMDMSWAGGAGELYSTVGDLGRWTEALQGGRILSPDKLKTMLTETDATKKETLTRYGMGLYHSEIGWLPVVGHNGGLPGYSSTVMYFPEQKMTIAVLTNAAPSSALTPDAIVPMAARAFLGPEMTAHAPKVDPTVSPKSYSDYAGRYDFGSAIMAITCENGRIFGQLTDQDKFEASAMGPDALFWSDFQSTFIFHRNSAGLVDYGTFSQDGMTFNALKLSDKDYPVVSLKALDAIVGQYQYGPQTVLTVTRQGDQLYADITGQPEAPIFPKSDHEFFWKVVPASVEFVRGPDGKITSAIHHQNGITFNAPRLKVGQR
jgi:CubicO group peptidase (beta-lactamase class C family)